MRASSLTFSDIIKIFTGPTEERRGRPFRPNVTYKVDLVEGDEITTMCLISGDDRPFWRTFTTAEIDALVASGDAIISANEFNSFAPRGECSYCDNQRTMDSTFFPSHNASSRCRSGGRSHCTCDTCF